MNIYMQIRSTSELLPFNFPHQSWGGGSNTYELVFSGYEDDPRELWEIEDVRQKLLIKIGQMLSAGLTYKSFGQDTVNLMVLSALSIANKTPDIEDGMYPVKVPGGFITTCFLACQDSYEDFLKNDQ